MAPTANWHLRAHTRLSANPVPTLARCSLTSTSMESRDNIARHLSLELVPAAILRRVHTRLGQSPPRCSLEERGRARRGRRGGAVALAQRLWAAAGAARQDAPLVGRGR